MKAIRKIETDSLGRKFEGGYTGVLSASFEEAERLASAMFLGEKCFVCKKEYNTHEDLEYTVWLGSHSFGRLACKSCWNRTFLS